MAWKDGFANLDADALTSLYHEDGTLSILGFCPAAGHAEIRSVTQQRLDRGIDFAELEPLDVRLPGDLIVEYGRY